MAHILLVEPDRLLAKTYAKALQQQGHHVLSAQDAQSAVNATDAVTPDMVILELQLPHHNGIEFLYELRSHADWHDLPVVILSQLTPDQLEFDVNSYEELGIKAFCYKSDTSLTTLNKLVEEVINTAKK